MPNTDPKPTSARPSMPLDKQDQARARLDVLLVAAVVGLAFLLGSFPVKNSDFWMHLATGREIAQGRYQIGKDPFAYTTEGVIWVNHSWLYDLLTYASYETLGGSLLVALKGTLVAGLAVVLLQMRRPGQSPWLPAACTGLAVLTLSPRLFFQPIIVSYLFLALTLLLLFKARHSRWLWLLVPLFVLWVNLDAWFFLGPITVALFLIGEGVQTFLTPPPPPERKKHSAAAAPVSPPVASPWLVLIVAVVACLINPHHVRAFTVLPVEVSFAGYTDQLRSVRSLEWLFYSPMQSPVSVATLAVFVLLAAGAASFLCNFRHLSWARLLVFAAFSGLVLLRVQCVGFFAVVAGPITALNFQDLVARFRPEAKVPRLDWAAAFKTLGIMVAVLVIFAILSKTSLLSLAIDSLTRAITGQADLSVAHTLGLPDPPVEFLIFAVFTGTVFLFAIGPLLRYLSDVLPRWSLAGRLLTVLTAVVLLAMVWPGWLQVGWFDPYQARRVGWSVEPDTSLTGIAERLKEWRQDGRLPPEVRGFALLPQAANHLAWFAPEEQGAFDQRFALFEEVIPEYVDLRNTLTAEQLNELIQPPASGAPLTTKQGEILQRLERLGQFFEDHHIRYVILTSDQRTAQVVVRSTLRLVGELKLWTMGDKNLAESINRQYPHLGRWELLDMDGRSLILSWSNSQDSQTDPLRALYFDPDKQAFAAPAPESRASDPLFEDTAPPAPAPRSDLSLYINPPPQRQLTSDRAGMDLVYFDVTDRSAFQGRQLAMTWNLIVNPVLLLTSVCPDAGPIATGVLLAARLDLHGVQREGFAASSRFDLNSPAPALLGLRAGRRALRENPNDPNSYIRLALLYNALSDRTPERHWNQRGALANTKLLTAMGLPTHGYDSAQFLPELGVLRRVQITAAAQQAVALAPTSPEAHEVLAAVYEEGNIHDLAVKHSLKALELRAQDGPIDEEQRARREEQKKTIENVKGAYLLEAAKYPQITQKALLARQNYGLLEDALDVILSPGSDEYTADAIRLQIELLLQSGRIEELRVRWCGSDGRLKPDLRVLGPLSLTSGWLVSAYDWYGLLMAAATGDYSEADRCLEEMLKPLDPVPPVLRAIGNMMQETLQPTPYLLLWRQLDLGQTLQQSAVMTHERANILCMRGLLTLERGDVEKARQYFHEALSPENTSTGLPATAGSQALARYYLGLCQKAER